jgi:hypothetical protein
MKVSEEEKEIILEAADALDEAWDYDAARGLRDAHGGAEYRNTSLGHKLRRLALPDIDERLAEQEGALTAH